VLDSAVNKAYGGKRKIEWLEVLAGEKAFNKTGQWLPAETLVRGQAQLVVFAHADRHAARVPRRTPSASSSSASKALSPRLWAAASAA
jgi:hypothetical protein